MDEIEVLNALARDIKYNRVLGLNQTIIETRRKTPGLKTLIFLLLIVVDGRRFFLRSCCRTILQRQYL